MKKKFKSLIQTNKYLKDELLRDLLIRRSCLTSSMVELLTEQIYQEFRKDLNDVNERILSRMEQLGLKHE